ncbi:PAN domain-containing protein [Chondromyces apiculatus]|uniref:Bulb-type lectin domain-containing protein n=1 Tax=Chondromyces apiculatus DSM 436 TaxID=1192034 RepID=A0A017T6P0_9BACT|nr:PAN domain-containing protein [Chondromyces apiculatus]EYF04455.1 Hypothetical protein CAP_4423 [Chondromyces apiculatus DSM 436]
MKKLALALSLAVSTLAAAPSIAQADGTLSPDEFLFPGQRVTAPGCYYRMRMQSDGNLVVAGGTGSTGYLWQTNTVGSGYFVAMQTDGNFVMYDWDGVPIWSSDTWGHPGSVMDMQSDGNAVVYSPGGSPLWASDTDGQSLGQSPCRSPSVSTQLDVGYDRPGGDYAVFNLSRGWEVDCAYACSQDAACQSFTYAPPGFHGPSAVCILKSSVPGAVHIGNGVISGRILRD